MMQLFNKILNAGIDSTSDDVAKKIRILNGIAFFSTVILLINGIVIFASSYPFEKFTLSELYQYLTAGPEIKVAEVQKFRIIFRLLDFVLAFFASGALLLNHFHKQNISTIIILLVANIYIAFFYWIAGFFSVFFFFIPALLPLIFYKKRNQYLPFLLFTLILFFGLTIVKYNIGINDLFLRPPADKALLNSLLNFSAVLLILFFIVFHFKKENIKHEKKLEEKNKILDKQSREIKLQRDELSDSEKELKEANVTKDKFISILAHDLKNPFQSLLGFSELLLENFRDYDDDEIEFQLKAIHQTSNTAFELLEQILLWANTQTKKLTLKPEELSFNEITHDLISEFENQAGKKKIEIKSLQTEDIVLTADVNIVKTVMRNLIANAIKYSHQNSEIRIFAEKINHSTTITVSDNGTGIEENVIPKLWELHESYTTLGTNRESGTGLGLKLCKELVELHNGTIWVESEPGKGSDFKFTIPDIETD